MASPGTVDTKAAIDHGLASREDLATTGTCRALIPVHSARFVASACRLTGPRATAPFLAHLLATAQGVPQTRARRRAEPGRAVTAYADRMQTPPPVGRAVRESR
jgi:hypothetical protein